MLLSGRCPLLLTQSAQQGKPTGSVYTVDVAPTALAHMGVKVDPAWKLDGKSVGLRAQP